MVIVYIVTVNHSSKVARRNRLFRWFFESLESWREKRGGRELHWFDAAIEKMSS